jgi:hypothetical protein
MTGLTLRATGLYFFLKKIGKGVFEAGASDDGMGEKEKVETLKGEGELKKQEVKMEELEGVMYSVRREVSAKEERLTDVQGS